MTFWAVIGTLAGLSLMITTGAATFRYERFAGYCYGDCLGAALFALFLFPIALPIIIMLWAGRWPERRESRIIAREMSALRIRRALEAEALAPLDAGSSEWPDSRELP